MGFIPFQVVESVVSTLSGQGNPNAAPMGIWIEEGPKLLLRPFQETQTARNLTDEMAAVINVTDDPRIFFTTAFKDEFKESSKILSIFLT